MEKEARERKERLLKLKQRNLTIPKADNEDSASKVLKFRNFQPTSETLLEKSKVESVSDVLPEDNSEAPTEGTVSETQVQAKRPLSPPTVEQAVIGITDAVIAEQKQRIKEDVNLTNLAPTKPNWDLKRDIEKKLKKLDMKTQIKIHELVRERIKAQHSLEAPSNNAASNSGKELIEAIDAQAKLDRSYSDEEEA